MNKNELNDRLNSIQHACCQEHMISEIKILRRLVLFGEGPRQTETGEAMFRIMFN